MDKNNRKNIRKNNRKNKKKDSVYPHLRYLEKEESIGTRGFLTKKTSCSKVGFTFNGYAC